MESLEARLLGRAEIAGVDTEARNHQNTYQLSAMRNTIAAGDSEEMLQDLPAESVDLVFTSPPYYNARPEYTDYITYEEYLLKLRKVIHNVHRVLAEGRFFVINVSPVLIRRSNRNESSKRIAVPFDIHRLFIEEGYDFMDDIIWEKPEGAGWATGRGRRFAADRNPLQYKPVPVTEYILVYRKRTNKLIDWNIRAHPKQELVQASRIDDGYERTNIWRIKPAHDSQHPAIFPVELAEKVISYYSFKEDVVLDPFAGIGTVGEAAVKLGRRFVLIEQNPQYVSIMRSKVKDWLGVSAKSVFTINCAPITTEDRLF
jgi:DNA modification methylase